MLHFLLAASLKSSLLVGSGGFPDPAVATAKATAALAELDLRCHVKFFSQLVHCTNVVRTTLLSKNYTTFQRIPSEELTIYVGMRTSQKVW